MGPVIIEYSIIFNLYPYCVKNSLNFATITFVTVLRVSIVLTWSKLA